MTLHVALFFFDDEDIQWYIQINISIYQYRNSYKLNKEGWKKNRVHPWDKRARPTRGW